MEYRYYRELKHNYLVFEYTREETEDQRYQCRIMESGRISNLVPCAERNINGVRYLYYEINSMQSLKDRFAVSKMDHAQLIKLLSDIKALIDSLSEFLMGQDGIVFNVMSIYTDLNTGEYKFIFCPFFDEQNSFYDFSMELLEIVDEQDEEATNLIYKLCEESLSRGDFIYEVIENVKDTDEGKEVYREEERALPHYGEVFREEEPYEDEADEPWEKEESGLVRANKRLSGKLQLFLSLMFMILVAAMVYIRMNYILSTGENILSIAVMIVSAVTGMVALIGGFKEMKKEPSEKKSIKEADHEEDYEDDFEGRDFFSESGNAGTESTEKFTNMRQETVSFPQKRKPEAETVVLDEEGSAELALFSRNLDKTVRISLKELPVTIGKMEGCVDVVLSDPSISRMHCRIEDSNGKVAIRDLGSTNGSFRNGLRLMPQGKAFIEEGDEIRIGRVCFDCR